jgi:hypothetical protein
MKIWRTSFNIYLWAVLWGLAAAGGTAATAADAKQPAQKAPETKKKPSKSDVSTIRFHYVISPDGSARCLPITVYRSNPLQFYIDRSPCLWEVNVAGASVNTNLGAYSLRIWFDREGTKELDAITSAYRGRHLAIFSEFGGARWLGAPLIPQRITNGVFEFTPDASLEETERIARGLSNVARKNTSIEKSEKKPK